jgi:hypothetical protein
MRLKLLGARIIVAGIAIRRAMPNICWLGSSAQQLRATDYVYSFRGRRTGRISGMDCECGSAP